MWKSKEGLTNKQFANICVLLFYKNDLLERAGRPTALC